MKMNKRKYRIGDLAKHLKVEKFVIRFWEKELCIKQKRSKGGQRFYQESDFQAFLIIKDLLYNKKFTIAGAKEELLRLRNAKTENTKQSTVIASKRAFPDSFQAKLLTVKERLIKLQEKLLA